MPLIEVRDKNGNIISSVYSGDQAAETAANANAQSVRTAAQGAIATNIAALALPNPTAANQTYIALASPSAAQQTAQVKALTQQVNALVAQARALTQQNNYMARLLTGQFDATN